MKDNLNEILTHPVLAAAVGALVGLRALPGSSLPEKLLNVGAGFAIAAWGGSAIVEHLSVTSPKIAAGMVFFVGAAGLVVFNALIEAIKRTDLAAWLSGWLPRKGGQ
jgi:uncharacterized membrane protein YedE/YeeE